MSPCCAHAGVNAIADVRSTPASRFFPWFSAKNLAALLAREGIGYLPYGDELGGRPRDRALYRDGVADYEAMAQQPMNFDPAWNVCSPMRRGAGSA